ncbi:MAG: DUF5924 family protein [Myxococcales bacterium]
MNDSTKQPAPSSSPPSPWDRRLALARKLMPWSSLALGLASALLMDRSPERAGFIAAAAVLGWALLIALAQVHRAKDEHLPQRHRLALRTARFGSLFASQYAIQLSLFFALPFYARATPWHPAHLLFLAGLSAAALLTLWDPWFTRLLARPGTALAMQACASFAALNVVLPVLGASNRVSLWVSAALTAVAIPATVAAMAQGERRRRALSAALAAALVPGVLALGGTRLVPPAPLRLVKASLGTVRAGYDVADPAQALASVPPQLVCATAVWAPRGLHDALFHVWAKDGAATDRIALTVEGGAVSGFHTWSVKKHLSPGTWSCRVETASGQLLGERDVVLGNAAPPPLPAPPTPASTESTPSTPSTTD